VVAAQTPPVEGDRVAAEYDTDDEIDGLLAAGRLRLLPGGARR